MIKKKRKTMTRRNRMKIPDFFITKKEKKKTLNKYEID